MFIRANSVYFLKRRKDKATLWINIALEANAFG